MIPECDEIGSKCRRFDEGFVAGGEICVANLFIGPDSITM